MGPSSLKLWAEGSEANRNMLSRACHVEISPKVALTLRQIAKSLPPKKHIFEGRMPSPEVVFEYPLRTGLLIATDLGDSVLIEDFSRNTNRKWSGCRSQFFKRSASYCASDANGTALAEGPASYRRAVSIITLDILFTLMAEPRVLTKLAPRRPYRRQAKRSLGRITTDWHRIEWTVGEEVIPSEKRDRKLFRQPLHYCRAHWRRTHEGAPKAEVRRGHDGHWCWVQGCFKGHPDYGVKLASYEPHVDPLGVSEPVLAALTA